MLIPSLAPPRCGARAKHPPMHGQAPVAGQGTLRAAPFPRTKGFLQVTGSVCWAALPRFSLEISEPRQSLFVVSCFSAFSMRGSS